ncbi:unnamed protein product [Phytomonas sp. Hart1]|nr:unnamed protein product [Phytomonas sp. Hart1]|eukprot:CCW67929.1 unnamed protein product [Phytomonas sp. isolate Hart1]
MSNPFEKDLVQDPFKEHEMNNIDSYLPPSIISVDINDPINAQPPTTYGGAVLTRTPYNGAEIHKEGKGFAEGTPQPPLSFTTAAVATPHPTNAQTSQAVKATSKFWTIEFYQQLFDITTQQVLIRISNTLVPITPPDFLMDRHWHYATGNNVGVNNPPSEVIPQEDLIIDGIVLSRNPDLYGPFWICTTLWMLLGMVSNIMARIAHFKYEKDPSKTWTYDFSVASVACMVIYLYCFALGAAVWMGMHWKNLPITLTDTLCLYGYSMFIFIIAALLCMIPINMVQWVVVMFCGMWSAVYILSNLWHMLKSALDQRSFLIFVGLMVFFHMVLSLSFKFYFMNYRY